MLSNITVPPLMTVFQEFKPSLFGVQPVQVSSFHFAPLSLQALSSQANQQSSSIEYQTKGEKAVTSNFTFSWKSDKGEKGQAKGFLTLSLLQLKLQFSRTQARKLNSELMLEDLQIEEMLIVSGITKEYVQQRAQQLILSQVIGNMTSLMSKFLSESPFPLFSSHFTSILGSDKLLVWHHSRLPPLTKLLNFTLDSPPSLTQSSLVLDFSAKASLSKSRPEQILSLRALQQAAQNTCSSYSSQFLKESILSGVSYYAQLFYFNRTLSTQFPLTQSFSPFYNYEVVELMMWGSGVWQFVESRLASPSKLQILNQQLQLDCRNVSDSQLSISQEPGKTESRSIRLGQASLKASCSLQVLHGQSWLQLFDIQYEVAHDVTLFYTSQGEYLLKGSISNPTLVAFSTPNLQFDLYLSQLSLRINSVLNNLPLKQIHLLGEGLHGFKFQQSSVTLEVTEAGGLMICGNADLS